MNSIKFAVLTGFAALGFTQSCRSVYPDHGHKEDFTRLSHRFTAGLKTGGTPEELVKALKVQGFSAAITWTGSLSSAWDYSLKCVELRGESGAAPRSFEGRLSFRSKNRRETLSQYLIFLSDEPGSNHAVLYNGILQPYPAISEMRDRKYDIIEQ